MNHSLTDIRATWLVTIAEATMLCPDTFQSTLLELALTGNRLLTEAWLQGEIDMVGVEGRQTARVVSGDE